MATEPKKRRKSSRSRRSGVNRFQKGRTICDTLFGRTRYGKDLVTNNWVIIKESKKAYVNKRISRHGLPVAEDLMQEIAIHRKLMALTDDSEDQISAWKQHIVELIEVCEDPTYIYIVTEWCRGGDLLAYIKTMHPYCKKDEKAADSDVSMDSAEQLTPEEIAQQKQEEKQAEMAKWFQVIRSVFGQLCRGVAWMHEHRFCHRDLSLENVLLTKEGVVKIIDFGVSKQYGEENENFITQPGFVGKQGYCSPEVYNLNEYDGRANDIWALGVILFMLVTGSPPYQVSMYSDPGFKLLMEGKLQVMVVDMWKRYVEVDAVDLLCRIFTAESDRINIHSILDHPWLQLNSV